jgi:hypothetical protein
MAITISGYFFSSCLVDLLHPRDSTQAFYSACGVTVGCQTPKASSGSEMAGAIGPGHMAIPGPKS